MRICFIFSLILKGHLFILVLGLLSKLKTQWHSAGGGSMTWVKAISKVFSKGILILSISDYDDYAGRLTLFSSGKPMSQTLPVWSMIFLEGNGFLEGQLYGG